MRKKIIIAIAIIVGIPLILITILYLFANPNQYKPMITKVFFEGTHRKLELNGNIKIKLFPYIGLQMSNVAIKNPDGFSSQNTVSINEVNVKVELKPLFSHQININSISINGLVVSLISNGNLNNWQFNIAKQNISESNNTSTIAQNQFNLSMKSLKITNSSINYSDLKTKKSYLLTNININLPDLNQRSFTVNNNQIVVNNLKFNLNNIQNAQLNLIVNNFDSAQLSYSGNLKIPEFSLNTFSKYLNLPLPVVRNKKLFDSSSIYCNFFGNKNSINLADLNIGLGNTSITGSVAVLEKNPENYQQRNMVTTNGVPILIISNNLKINKLDLSDIKSINGFKIPLERINVTGKATIPMGKVDLMQKIMLDQNINVSRVILIGASLRNSIDKINGLTHIDLQNIQKINIDSTRVLSNIKSAFDPFLSKGAKDLSKQTDLGELYANVQIHNGTLSTPKVILNGPDLTSNASGQLKLRSKDINYSMVLKLKSQNKNDLINNLVFPVKIYGRTTNIQYKMDWASILTQILDYQSRILDGTTIKSSIYRIKKGAENIFHNLFK